MAKKTFRAVGSEQPRYPRPDELKSRSLRNLGLVAVGSLLLGTATIPNAKAEETKAEKPVQNVQLAGKPQPARLPSADQADSEPKIKNTTKGSKAKKSKAPPSAKRTKPEAESEILTRGLMPPPRHPDPVPTPKKHPPTPKPVPQPDAGVPAEPTKK